MSLKKIMLISGIGLPVCVLARVLQIALTIEYSNGFYIEEYKTLGKMMMLLIFAVLAVVAYCAFKAYKTPEQPQEINTPLAVSAFGVAIALCNEFIREELSLTTASWQILVAKLITFATIVYFLAFSLQKLIGFRLPELCHTVPFIYVAVKTAYTFINISALALISDNVLIIAAYCVLMLFFINFGKFYNKLETENSFRKVLATGFTVSILCIGQSVAYFLVNLFGSAKYLHVDASIMFTLLLIGVFVALFTLSYFNKTE
jgi:hypothetical protein